MNYDDLQALQNDIHRLHTRNLELELENEALKTLVERIENATRLAESGQLRHLPMWIRAAVEKVMVQS